MHLFVIFNQVNIKVFITFLEIIQCFINIKKYYKNRQKTTKKYIDSYLRL